MRFIFLILFSFLFLQGCKKKQIAGDRKIEAIGEIIYNGSTGLVSTEVFPKNDPRIFKMKFERDYDISGDVTGTWQESGAQMLLFIEGDFWTDSPFPIDHGYYETRQNILVGSTEVNMYEFTEKQYYIVVTKGYAGGTYFEKYFVFE